MSSKHRLSQNFTNSAHKLRLDSVNKILKIDRSKKQKRVAITKQATRIVLAELLKANNTPTKQRHDPPDFKTFLAQKDSIEAFREFLHAQYCQENLDFYLACEKYRKLNPHDGVGKEMVKFMATQIYNDFLGENARQPVNVNNACVQIIKKNLKDPQPNLLCDAQAEIFELMRTDCYPRFCKTWQLDEDLAYRILNNRQQETPQTISNKHSSCITSFVSEQCATNTTRTNSSQVSASPAFSSSQSSIRSSRSRSISTNSSVDCPPECPYFRIGRLPCQRHKRAPLNVEQGTCGLKRKHYADPLDQVDLRKIHRLPTVCTPENGLNSPSLISNSSPPPPLPPKPDNIDTNMIGNKRYRPYVGKVFNV